MIAPPLLAFCLVLLLAWVAWGDILRRDIPNAYVLAIALSAPLWWWAWGLALWPDVALRLGLALAVFGVFFGLWALRMMGGGDVKLIAALALWLPPAPLLEMLTVMALAGGLLTLATVVAHRWARRAGQPEIPYGVAIAVAGAWAVSNQILTIPAG